MDDSRPRLASSTLPRYLAWMGRKPLKVLCVEDDADAAGALRVGLEAAGHAVETVSEGAAGLDQLIEGRFDVAIVDIGLPFMNGYQLARAAHEILGDATPPLIALTGFTRSEDREAAAAAGFAAHLAKPVSVAAVLRMLERVARPPLSPRGARAAE